MGYIEKQIKKTEKAENVIIFQCCVSEIDRHIFITDISFISYNALGLLAENTFTDSDGNVEQDSHYYPYGMLMGESGDILATARNGRNPLKPSDANPYLYGGKEYLTTGGANLLDFTARTYDPSTLLFHTPDPLRDKYLHVNSYLYCGANPVNFIDPTGTTIKVNKEFQERVLTALGEAFGDKAKDFSFDGNGHLNFSGDNKGLSRIQKKLMDGVQQMIDNEDITEVYFGESVTVKDINNNDVTIRAEKGGGGGTALKSENPTLDRNIVVINPDVKETTVKAIDSKYFNSYIDHKGSIDWQDKKIDLTVSDMIFHEFGHILFDGGNQGKVLDYNNYFRKIIKLPTRPYDIGHNPYAL